MGKTSFAAAVKTVARKQEIRGSTTKGKGTRDKGEGNKEEGTEGEKSKQTGNKKDKNKGEGPFADHRQAAAKQGSSAVPKSFLLLFAHQAAIAAPLPTILL